MPATVFDHDVVVIGSGFGGTLVALTLAEKVRDPKPKILILERGTWWTTPVPTVQDKAVAVPGFLREHGQPVQFWPSVEHFRGFIDIITRCLRRPRNEDGLYDIMQFGKRGFLGLGRENDGVSVLRACGVGGGSLVYSNITIRPPNFVLEDPRWPLTWSPDERNRYFHLARHAIGYGVVSAWRDTDGNLPWKDPGGAHALPPLHVNAGLSNITTRSARLAPGWDVAPDRKDGRDVKRIHIAPPGATQPPTPPEGQNRYWIDRARVFQSAMAALGVEHGTVDSSINDLTPEGTALAPSDPQTYPGGSAINYCERQGRCNVGCLPAARHTLNKQIMAAIYGTPANPNPTFDNLKLEALADVDVVRALPGGGYQVDYVHRSDKAPWRTTAKSVRARRVVVAAGCVGTNEIMLRSKARGALPNLSERCGFGFSTNGDYIAFLEGMHTRDGKPVKVGLSRGPVTTSFAHFNSTESDPTADPTKFHILEDQGVPRVLASTVGFGVPLIRSLSKGRHRQPLLLLAWAILLWAWRRLLRIIRSLRLNSRERQGEFESEDEWTYDMMCVVGAGREASVGQFHLGTKAGETSLRVKRTDGREFHRDPIFAEIRKSLDSLAVQLGSKGKFLNPFLTPAADQLAGESVTVSHPLGGCRMAKSAAEGVVDEFGRVFDAGKSGPRAFYEGLYVADAAVIPTALGVNPSLTISAVALRIGEKIAQEMA